MTSTTVSPSSTITRSSLLCPSASISENPLPKTESFLTFKTQEPKISPPHTTLGFSTKRVGVASAVNNNAPKKLTKNPIFVIDNYDSFTYNLCQYLGDFGCTFQVYRNDELTVEELKKKNPRGVLISPGPGTPQDSGISLQTVLELGPIVPLFGVCMGLQCIGEAFGGKIIRSPFGVMHGKSSPVYYNEGEEEGLLAGLSKSCVKAATELLTLSLYCPQIERENSKA